MNAQPKKRILLILSILAAIFTSSTAFADYNHNGIVESGEECDDGNPTNGDGCSSEGKLEWIKACEATDRNCIEVAVITPLPGNVANKADQVIAGLFRPAKNNPTADFDTAAQSFTVSVVKEDGTVTCSQDFDETDLSQAMVRPLWAFKCDQQIKEGSKVKVTYKGGEQAEASWPYKAPVEAGVSVTKPEDFLVKYNIANSTVELDSDGQLTKWPTNIPTLGGQYWGGGIENSTMRMHFYKTTPDSNLKFVRTATNIEKPSVESQAGLGWSLKSIANAFESAKKYYGPDESGVFFFQPYFEWNEKILSSGRVALRDMMRPNLKDVTFNPKTNTVSGIIYDGDSDGASGERFATVTVRLEDNSLNEVDTYKTTTGLDGQFSYKVGMRSEPGNYRIKVTATDRAGNESVDDPDNGTKTFDWHLSVTLNDPKVVGGEVSLSGKTENPRQQFNISVKKKGDANAPNLVETGTVSAGGNGAPGEKDWKLTLSDLPPGIYVVDITTDGGNPVSGEFKVVGIGDATVEGNNLSVSGVAAAAGSTVSLKITKDGQDVIPEKMVPTDASGQWSDTIDIAKLAPGEYKIVVGGAEKDFTVGPKINDTTVSDGTLNAQGDAVAGSTVIVEIKKDGQVVRSEPVTARADGTWDANVALDGLAPGKYEVTVGGVTKEIVIPDDLTGTTAGGCSSTDSSGGLLALLLGVLGMIGITRRRN